jgi:cytochrome c-type biogenesis protein CcmH/NrfF
MVDEQMAHPPMMSPQDMVSHIREMMDQGLTNEQILELHPEIQSYFTQSE